MSKKARHVLGLSGGKDSAALAVWMNNNYPDVWALPFQLWLVWQILRRQSF